MSYSKKFKITEKQFLFPVKGIPYIGYHGKETKFADWQYRKDRQYGRTILEGDTFEIYLQPRDYSSKEGYKFNILNISFDKLIDKKPIKKFILTDNQVEDLYKGIVSRIYAQKLQDQYDAITCLAFDNHYEREKVYSCIATPISKSCRIYLGSHSCAINRCINSKVDAYINCTRELWRESEDHFNEYLSALTMRWIPNWDNK